jgi:hypothetical protein
LCGVEEVAGWLPEVDCRAALDIFIDQGLSPSLSSLFSAAAENIGQWCFRFIMLAAEGDDSSLLLTGNCKASAQHELFWLGHSTNPIKNLLAYAHLGVLMGKGDVDHL